LKIKDNFSSQLSQRSYNAHCTKISDQLGMYCLYNKRLTVLVMKKAVPMLKLRTTLCRPKGILRQQYQVFLNSALDRGEWCASRRGDFSSGRRVLYNHCWTLQKRELFPAGNRTPIPRSSNLQHSQCTD